MCGDFAPLLLIANSLLSFVLTLLISFAFKRPTLLQIHHNVTITNDNGKAR
jgi:hypothetical protein